MARRRSEAGGGGQSLLEFAGGEEDGAGQREVAEGLAATAAVDPLGLPSMGPGYERIQTKIFKVDVLAEYEELERGLKFDRPAHRLEYGELVDALDAATDNALRAHRLVANAKVAREAFELDCTIAMADMRDQARVALEGEKKSGARTKQITEGDVEAWMSWKFADEWRSVSERRAKALRMCENLERLSDLWMARRNTLDTLVKGARRV